MLLEYFRNLTYEENYLPRHCPTPMFNGVVTKSY